MRMKTCKSAIMVIISIVFVAGLCSQALAKKQAGPTPGKMSVNDLKKYKMIKTISASRLDITPKVVAPGGSLSFRGSVSCNEINQHIADPEKYLKPGDKVDVVVLTKNWSWGAGATVTCPEPGKTATIHNHEWTNLEGCPETYVVPTTARPGSSFTFYLVLVACNFFPVALLAESSVTVSAFKPDIEQQRTIDRKPIIEQKPAIKEQKPMIKQK
jgi:hypothetical protein